MCDDNVKKGFTLCGAGSVFVAGLAMTIIAGMALNSNNLADADSMINANTANGDGVSIDLTKCFTGVMVFGILAIVTSILGCLGIIEHNKFLLCLYVVAALLFATFFLAVGISMFMVVESIEPQIERQVDTMCVPANYDQLMKKMICTVPVAPTAPPATPAPPGAATPAPPAAAATAPTAAAATARLLKAKPKVVDKDPCGPECESKVALIQRMGGCPFLKDACNKKEYAFVGEGFCTLPDTTRPPMYASAPLSKVDLELCYDTCDADIDCTGIVHQKDTGVCFIITKDGNRPTAPGWVLQKQGGDATVPLKTADGTAGASCQTKDVSKLVARLKFYGFWFFFGLIAFGTALTVSICCTFSHMYMVNTKRKGRKGFPALCASMFCPCLRTKNKNRMLKDYDDEDGSGSASDSDE